MSVHSVSLYLRDGTLHVLPQDGGGSVFWEVEPVQSIEPDAGALAAALPEALAASHVPAPDIDLRRHRSPLMRVLGTRSHKDFERGSAHTVLRRTDTVWLVMSWVPARDGRGWEPGDMEELPADTPLEAVAERAVELLRELPTA